MGNWKFKRCRLLLMEEIMHNVGYPIIYKVYNNIYQANNTPSFAGRLVPLFQEKTKSCL